jgi:hypothetical protein
MYVGKEGGPEVAAMHGRRKMVVGRSFASPLFQFGRQVDHVTCRLVETAVDKRKGENIVDHTTARLQERVNSCRE